MVDNLRPAELVVRSPRRVCPNSKSCDVRKWPDFRRTSQATEFSTLRVHRRTKSYVILILGQSFIERPTRSSAQQRRPCVFDGQLKWSLFHRTSNTESCVQNSALRFRRRMKADVITSSATLSSDIAWGISDAAFQQGISLSIHLSSIHPIHIRSTGIPLQTESIQFQQPTFSEQRRGCWISHSSGLRRHAKW